MTIRGQKERITFERFFQYLKGLPDSAFEDTPSPYSLADWVSAFVHDEELSSDVQEILGYNNLNMFVLLGIIEERAGLWQAEE
ncbi:MAG TPA: hypothetical protein VJI75_05855 [Candidatus Nanoarchaeia archaeon]|nr:hypothetical protein [Candidatus Nanoarchaeia archaeon]